MHEVITTRRLELHLLSLQELEELAVGNATGLATRIDAEVGEAWVSEVAGLAGFRARQLRERPGDEPWLLRAIVTAEADERRRAIGYLNFHAGPDERGMVEIGYTLMPDARGRGYAIEAVRGAFEWATQEFGIRRFRASISPGNERSENLIFKLGFVRTGEQWDDRDGLEYVYELER
ncbi:MAG TPA: GNAT family N-acetyltransferase [Candidatus Limnocylindria bacterium]|jgi:RimJ/RimL family protein N-acetyltransferase